MTQNQSGRQSTARSGRRQGYRRRRRRLRAAGAAACLLALIGAASWALRSGPDSRVRPGGDSCQRLRVVAASGYADVIRRVSATVRTGPEEDPTGTVLATTPVYMITDRTTGRRIAAAGSSWRGLAGLASGPGAVRIKVVDPEHSGDGLGMPPKAGATADAGTDAGTDALPTLSTPAFDVLTDHRVEHVLAAWKPTERRARILVVIDVSQSMNARAPGSDKPLLNVVAEGCLALAKLLPDDSTLGVWVFGTQLQGTRDHQVLVPPGPLDARQRGELPAALGDLRTRRTGTGLYDTVLAAYRADLSSPVEDAPPAHVLVFTDGRNEADPGSVSSAELGRQLLAARRVQQPRSLSVLAFGRPTGRDEVTAAIKPVGGYLEPALTAQDVTAAFVHLAAGGLHSEYGGS
jgi:hypothetical protein